MGPWVGTLRLRSHAGLIDLHSAAEQPRAQPSRREDREYLEPYESPQPGELPLGAETLAALTVAIPQSGGRLVAESLISAR